MIELTANPEAKSGPASETPLHVANKTPEQLFVEFLQQHGLVAEAYAVAPTGDAINARAYLPAGWRLLVNVVEAKKQ